MTAAALLRSAAQLTQQRTRQRGRIWLVPDLLCLHAILFVEYLACSVRSAPLALAAARRSRGAVAPPGLGRFCTRLRALPSL